MPSMSLVEFTEGGGGLLGAGKVVILGDVRAVKHSFKKKDKTTGAIVQTYEPGCMVVMPFEIEEPDDDDSRFVEQYYPVGNLPSTPNSLTGPGGYLPSTDNETGADEGPFIITEGVNNFGSPITSIYKLSQFAQLMDEFNNLGLKNHQDRVAAQGLAALKGTRVRLGVKVWKVSEKKAASKKPGDKDRSGLVPDQVLEWGWDRKAGATVPKGAAAKSAANKAAVAGKPTAAAAASASNGAGVTPAIIKILTTPPFNSTSADPAAVQARAIEVMQELITQGGGTLLVGVDPEQVRKTLGQKVMSKTTKDAGLRPPIMAACCNLGVLAELAEGDDPKWLWDGETGTLMGVA